MKNKYKKIVIMLVFIGLQFLLITSSNAKSSTVETTYVKLEAEMVEEGDSEITVYLTINNTDMENGLAGFHVRIGISPCSDECYGYIYGDEEPEIEVLTDGWMCGGTDSATDGTSSDSMIYFSGWGSTSWPYLDVLVELSDVSDETTYTEVEIAITLPVTEPYWDNSTEETPYSELNIVSLERTDLYNNVDEPSVSGAQIQIVKLADTDYSLDFTNGAESEDESDLTYLKNIIPGNTIEEAVSKYIDTNMTLKWYTSEYEEITNTSQKIATGMILRTYQGSSTEYTEEYVIVVTGDTDGDGSITETDITAMAKHKVGLQTLEGAYLLATDLDSDDDCATDIDLMKIVRVQGGSDEL